MSPLQTIALFFLGFGATLMGAAIARGEYTAMGKITRCALLVWVVGAAAVAILTYLP